jgi:hypothetical protein
MVSAAIAVPSAASFRCAKVEPFETVIAVPLGAGKFIGVNYLKAPNLSPLSMRRSFRGEA